MIQEAGAQAHYGRWETYSLTESLIYPDFKILFTGSEEGAFYPNSTSHRMGRVYKFAVSGGASKTTVSWSSGTGDIGPSLFEVGGKKFFLEMFKSNHLKLPALENQIAIWPEAEYS